jgi:hypothetical protein
MQLKDHQQHAPIHRRLLLQSTLVLGLVPLAAHATPESIRRAAAKIPGYGPADLVFPADWQGVWRVENIDAEAPAFKMRFIAASQGAILDRAYNMGQTGAMQSITWSPDNPNDLRIIDATGRLRDYKVTKRAAEASNTDGVYSMTTSEVTRISIENARGIPQITARRTVTKYRQVDPDTVQAIELVYDVGGGQVGDPLAFTANSLSQSQPQLISKSRLLLKRIQE